MRVRRAYMVRTCRCLSPKTIRRSPGEPLRGNQARQRADGAHLIVIFSDSQPPVCGFSRSTARGDAPTCRWALFTSGDPCRGADPRIQPRAHTARLYVHRRRRRGSLARARRRSRSSVGGRANCVHAVITKRRSVPDLQNRESQPVELLEYIRLLEAAIGKKAKFDLRPMQPGDIVATAADMSALEAAVGFRPTTPLKEGVRRYVEWHVGYHGAQ